MIVFFPVWRETKTQVEEEEKPSLSVFFYLFRFLSTQQEQPHISE